MYIEDVWEGGIPQAGEYPIGLLAGMSGQQVLWESWEPRKKDMWLP